MDELSGPAQRILHALTTHPGAADTVELDQVVALAGGAPQTAEALLAELASAGHIVQVGAARYRLTNGVHSSSHHLDEHSLRLVVEWFTLRATKADRAVQPDGWRLSPAYSIPGQYFTGRTHAKEWFTENRDRLLTLLDTALEHGWYELTAQLAEAMWSLFWSAGDHQHELATQLTAREAHDRLHKLNTSVNHSRTARAHCNLGNSEQALADADTGVRLADEIAHPTALSTALSIRARAHRLAGRPHDSLEDLKRSLLLAEQTGDVRSQALRERALGNTYAQLGHIDEAFAHLERAADLMDGISDHVGHARALTDFARLSLHTGRPEEAVAELRVALTVMVESHCDFYAAEVLELLGRCAETTGAPKAASDYYVRAIGTYDNAGRPDHADRVRDHLKNLEPPAPR